MRSLPSRCRPANWSGFIRACIDKPGTLSHEIANIPTTRHTIETATETKMMRQSSFIRIARKLL